MPLKHDGLSLSFGVGLHAHHAVNRHISFALPRVLLAGGVAFALPVSHALWGEPYPGDGQKAFGFIIIFTVIGFAASTVFFSLGSIAQILLRNRPAGFTVLADSGLFSIFAGALVYGGVTARYTASQPNHALMLTAPSTRLAAKTIGLPRSPSDLYLVAGR